MDWNMLLQLITGVGAALGVYVGVRIDLAAMHERIKAADARISVVTAEANKAHDRIDAWYRSEPRK